MVFGKYHKYLDKSLVVAMLDRQATTDNLKSEIRKPELAFVLKHDVLLSRTADSCR